MSDNPPQSSSNPTPQSSPSTVTRLGKIGLRPKTLIRWTPAGEPIPYTEWVVPKAQIENVQLAALSLPFEGTPDPFNPGEMLIEPEFDGLTNLEVAAIKTARKAANGDLEAFRMIQDRLLGKPKQAIESTTVTATLSEYLETLGLEQKAQEWQNKTIDITPTKEAPKPPSSIGDEL